MHVLVYRPELDKVTPEPQGRAAWRRELQARVPDARFSYPADEQELVDLIDQADIVAGFLPPAALERAHERLKWVHSWAAGPNPQLYDAFRRSDIVLTCCKSNGAIPLAEHAIMLMLMLQRDAVRWLDDQRARRWNPRPHGELTNHVCAIIGTGYSGTDLALKAKAFHMRVTGLRRSQRPALGFDAMYQRERLHEFLAEADFVVVTAPRTSETIGMIGKSEFQAMKPSAYFVCFSRGGIAEDAALLDALRNGKIAGAGLDAHSDEPLPGDSPFWDAPNTIVTPHNGATTPQTHMRGLEIFIDNLRRWLSGQSLVNVVDKQTGY